MEPGRKVSPWLRFDRKKTRLSLPAMKVMKFGGTSVGKPERMHHISRLVTKEEEPIIVVLSALSGHDKFIGGDCLSHF